MIDDRFVTLCRLAPSSVPVPARLVLTMVTWPGRTTGAVGLHQRVRRGASGTISVFRMRAQVGDVYLEMPWEVGEYVVRSHKMQELLVHFWESCNGTLLSWAAVKLVGPGSHSLAWVFSR